jgi:hypothetical protein
MANDSERLQQDLPDPATAERTDGPRIADPHLDEPREPAAAAQDGMVASSRSETQPQAESPAGPLPDNPISDLVQRFERLQPQIKETAPQLTGAINALSYSASQPDQVNTPHFKTALAYTLEDVEKHRGPLPVDPSLRDELSRLAATSPGLKNEQMQSLLLLTPTLADRDLVTQLRVKAAEVATQPNQNTAAIRDDLNAMAYQVLGAPRHQTSAAAGPSQPDAAALDRQNGRAAAARAPAPAVPQANRREAHSVAQEQMAAFDGTASPSTGNGRAQGSPGRPEASPQSPPLSPASARLPGAPAPTGTGVTAAQPPAAVQPPMEQRPAQRAALPSAPSSPQTDKKEDTPDPQKLILYQNRLALGGVVGNVLGKVRDAMTPQQNKPKTQQSSQETLADATSRQPVQAPQANMEQRFAAFESSRMDPRRDEAKLYAADQSARTALDALNTFSEGPGASIFNRIQDAASTTRGGIQQVLAEMRPGGAYEDLRKEFNTVLNDNPEFRSTYGRAADALEQYGKARESIIKTIPNQLNAKEWIAHFEKLDAEIGETASSIPGKKEGSALENLAENAREIVEAIINKVRNTLGYEARAESSPSPSASP